MDEMGSMSVLGFRIPVLVAITSLIGALAVLASYAAGLFSRRNKNASSNKATTDVPGRNGDGERTIDDPRISKNDDSSSVSQNPGTASSSAVNANGNTTSGKRAKNKKRREAQQEFAHPWMVGALKGHTGPVLDMNFSSNGKFLASCAEDCDPVPEEEPELGDASSSNGEGDYGLEEKSGCQGISVGSGSSVPSTASVVMASSGNNNNPNNNNNEAFVSPTGGPSSVNKLEKVRSSSSSSSFTSSSSSLSHITGEPIVVVVAASATAVGDRASLSRRQRKNRTRAPREGQQRARDRDDDNDDLSSTKQRHRPHHRLHHQPDVKLRHCRHESPTRGDSSVCKSTKSRNLSSSRNERKSIESPKLVKTFNDNCENITLKSVNKQISRVNFVKPGLHANSSKNTKNSTILRNNVDEQSFKNNRQHMHQLSESALASLMKRYVMAKSQCVTHGYPMEFDSLIDCVYIKHFQRPTMLLQASVHWYHNLDANAREFVPSNTGTSNTDNIISSSSSSSSSRAWNASADCEIDSGTGSGSSVESSDQEPECSSDSDKSSDIGESFSSSSSSSSSSSGYSDKLRRNSATLVESCESVESNIFLSIVERECARCMKNFRVNRDTGDYINDERCIYHWGKLLNSRVPGLQPRIWECCQSIENTVGCTNALMHVWTGLSPGYNGPFYDYVKTRPSLVFATDGNYGVYALDCEMCFTRRGLELTRVTIVDMTGRVIYDTLVKPHDEIIDYNTRFSGITADILATATKTLENVQKDILSFVHAETILIGHGLGNDLRALRLLHHNVIDTTVIYPHVRGFPVRRSLKTLARSVLGREIQVTEHDSVEDARTAAEIMIAKMWSDIY